MTDNITIEELRALVDLDAKTGLLYWRDRSTAGMSVMEARQVKMLNGRISGRLAFNIPNRYGYLRGTLFGKGYLAHRVVWALHFNQWPSSPLDHINRNRTDNRPGNLRLADARLNSRNRSPSVRNRSGYTGVAVMPDGRFNVTIYNKGRKLYCGVYASLDEAVSRRRIEEQKYGYLSNLIRSGKS